ncbi:DUF1330 domain-containing protein [Streptacidiphilus jiangxiensis]|uniref:Uncharacterized conserved protein, DUF1330 family n=1 Tax=Streptacidiphilus jiangxiensis TaxID=235985 RepID=A0A1H7QMD3_STRJI|nr:DUF1330 domain-containing protein [Streptacidiphilus jiangxiensis]SEL48387.1 Uncharacterized conserved protein, DUF1330 family [Streptacidiphilus jiangxiensis]
MTAYALAHVHTVEFGPEIVAYLEGIDATLDPFGGRFLVHGNPVDEVEGSWKGDLILIEFPDFERARAWWDSPAYRELAPLRTRHMVADIVLVPGVPDGYRGVDSLHH